MRIIRNAILTACGVLLLGCTDGADQNLTESMPASPSAISLASIRAGSDKVSGAGEMLGIGNNRFSVSAHSDPLGQDPRGHLRIERSGMLLANGAVSCLLVAGNRAVVGTDRLDAPGGQYLVVRDNGNPGDELADEATEASTGVPADEFGCAAVFSLTAGVLFPIDGNVRVTDALPAVP